MATAIMVGQRRADQKYFLVVSLYLKYCVMAVSNPITKTTRTITLLYTYSTSLPIAHCVSNNLLKKGREVRTMIYSAEIKNNKAPTNIQNSLEFMLSSFTTSGIA